MFYYSIDTKLGIQDEFILIFKELKDNPKWIYKEFDNKNIYDLVNNSHRSIFSNGSIINNYIGYSLCKLSNKCDFHNLLSKFDFIPPAYTISTMKDINKLNLEYSKNKYILKADRVEYAAGITLISSKDELLYNVKPNEKYILQELLHNVKLLNKCKFDIRMYVIITYKQAKQNKQNKQDQFNIYLFRDGWFRISPFEYDNDNHKSIVVNMNKEENNYVKFNPRNIYYNKYIKQIKDILKITCKELIKSNIECGNHLKGYNILGLDFIVDNNSKVWFLEVNHGPSLNFKNILPITKKLITVLVNDIIEPLLENKQIRHRKLLKIY